MKLKLGPMLMLQSPGVMPFYGDTGAGFRPAAGFGNTVWHQGVAPVGAVAVETSAAPWPPQQFIQQIPAPNQLEELRYHTQYTAAAPYHPQPGNWRGNRFWRIYEFVRYVSLLFFILPSQVLSSRKYLFSLEISQSFSWLIDREIFIFFDYYKITS